MSTDRPGGPPDARARRAPDPAGPFVLGLVGRAGSGKTTIARALAGAGAEWIDADRLGHEVTDTDPAVRAALAAEYGPAIYRADGTLDRARVAATVFSDQLALQRLNALVHPRILERIRGRIAELGARGFRGPVVVDAALLLDWGFQRECDAVIAVVATPGTQLARLREGRGWSAEEAKRRLDLQHPNGYFEAAADAVLANEGDEAAVARAALETLERLRGSRMR